MSEPLEVGGEAWLARVAEVAEETTVPDGGWWYFSFADATLPKGSQFLGACYVRGGHLPDAITRSHLLGINPGGEIASFGPLPENIADAIPVHWQERLMNRDEVAACDAEMKGCY